MHIDYDNRGHFKNCISMYELPLPAGWHKNSYLGLTATTGQLADNHDILGLQFSPNDMPLPERLEAPPLPISAGSDQLDRAIQYVTNQPVSGSGPSVVGSGYWIVHEWALAGRGGIIPAVHSGCSGPWCCDHGMGHGGTGIQSL